MGLSGLWSDASYLMPPSWGPGKPETFVESFFSSEGLPLR